ncbi:hypothetical protein BsWGS_23240 [Bradybaena similaris]
MEKPKATLTFSTEESTAVPLVADAVEDNESDETLDELSASEHANKGNPFWAPSLHELYKIKRCISEGSPGSVFIVKSKQEKKRYALKKIECHDESDARKVFYEESELKKLDHPNISSYKEFFITYDKECCTVYVNIISKYFPKGNLTNIIKEYQDKKTSIPEQKVKKILGEILEALVYLHDNGYLHRNIKPNNIFQRKGGAVVLGDLGVASIMGDLRTNTRQTFQGTVFMAPEIGQRHHDMKTDLYSVGGVLLNLLTTSMYSEHEFYKKLGEIKETPEELSVLLNLVSNIYSKPMVNTIQMLLRHKHSNRPSTLEFIKSGFVQECMALADVGQFEGSTWQTGERATVLNQLTEDRDDLFKVLKYIEDAMDNEECLADGLSALADILRDNDMAHELIDQKARGLINLAMWNYMFNKDIQISGCYILSNLIVSAKPNDVLFGQDVITIIHKIMTGHEHYPEVQLAAADLILALSANEKASQAIVQLGGIQDMLRAMRHAPYHATLNAVCCMALWSLAIDNGCYNVFDELDCVGNLVAAINLHTKNAKVVKNCCKVLATAIDADEDCAYKFIANDTTEDESPRGIPTVMKAYIVHKDNADVVESIVRLLLELSQYDDIAAELKAANVGSSLLSEVHKRYKQNKAIMGPVENALNKLDMLVSNLRRKSTSTPAIQGPITSRRLRLKEVEESCKAMTRKW